MLSLCSFDWNKKKHFKKIHKKLFFRKFYFLHSSFTKRRIKHNGYQRFERLVHQILLPTLWWQQKRAQKSLCWELHDYHERIKRKREQSNCCTASDSSGNISFSLLTFPFSFFPSFFFLIFGKFYHFPPLSRIFSFPLFKTIFNLAYTTPFHRNIFDFFVFSPPRKHSTTSSPQTHTLCRPTTARSCSSRDKSSSRTTRSSPFRNTSTSKRVHREATLSSTKSSASLAESWLQYNTNTLLRRHTRFQREDPFSFTRWCGHKNTFK